MPGATLGFFELLVGAISASAVATFVARTVLTIAIASIFQKKPKAPDFGALASDQQVTSREAVAAGRVIYGEQLTGGTYVFMHSSPQIASDIVPNTETRFAAASVAVGDVDLVWESDSSAQHVLYLGDGEFEYTPFTKVVGAPAPLQYSVTAGVYVFNAADFGKQITISYNATTNVRTIGRLLHLVIELACHEVEEIGDIYFDDEVVPLSGNAATGKYAGHVEVYKHLGTTGQTADARLMALAPDKWTSNHRLRGRAYIYVLLVKNPNLFQNGVPNIRAKIKGRKVYDPRSALTAWSANNALCVADYLTNADFGLGHDYATEIDEDLLIAAANVCDENVSLAAGGTEDRYTCNGAISTAEQPKDVLGRMKVSMAGHIVRSAGVWQIYAGAYITPTVTLDEDDLRGPIQVKPRLSRREVFNGVKGVYASPANGYQPADFPALTNATYLAEDDGEPIWLDMDLPFTGSASMAQRIAKIELERVRQQIVVMMPCKLSAWQVVPPQTVMVTNSRFGWTGKVFDVVDVKLVAEAQQDGAPYLGVDLILRETTSTVYDWSSGEETAVDPAPDTDLPNPFLELAITDLVAASGTDQLLLQGDGTVVPRIRLSWTRPANAFGKYYELQFAVSGEDPLVWRDAPDVLVPADSGFLLPLNDGETYDCRIRLVTTAGNAGDWAYVNGHTVVGKTALPSNVTGASAVQQGGLVVMGCNPVPDADLDTIEVRVHDEGFTDYADATPLANILRGETVTSAALPPGTWELLFKAKDTSGNYSATAAQVTITVTAEGYTTISRAAQATAWAGTLTHMVRHYTGVIVPESQDLAGDLDWEVFDEFVPNAYVDCYYEAPTIDKSIDAAARIYGDIVSVLGPGETGIAAPKLEVDYRLNAGSFDGFEVWTVGAANFRHMKARIHVDTTVGKPVISQFTPTIDGLARTETGTAVTPGGGSVAVTFAATFHNTPVLTTSPQGSGNVSSSWDTLTTSGFTGYYKSAGVAAAGTFSYSATGV